MINNISSFLRSFSGSIQSSLCQSQRVNRCVSFIFSRWGVLAGISVAGAFLLPKIVRWWNSPPPPSTPPSSGNPVAEGPLIPLSEPPPPMPLVVYRPPAVRILSSQEQMKWFYFVILCQQIFYRLMVASATPPPAPSRTLLSRASPEPREPIPFRPFERALSSSWRSLSPRNQFLPSSVRRQPIPFYPFGIDLCSNRGSAASSALFRSPTVAPATPQPVPIRVSPSPDFLESREPLPFHLLGRARFSRWSSSSLPQGLIPYQLYGTDLRLGGGPPVARPLFRLPTVTLAASEPPPRTVAASDTLAASEPPPIRGAAPVQRIAAASDTLAASELPPIRGAAPVQRTAAASERPPVHASLVLPPLTAEQVSSVALITPLLTNFFQRSFPTDVIEFLVRLLPPGTIFQENDSGGERRYTIIFSQRWRIEIVDHLREQVIEQIRDQSLNAESRERTERLLNTFTALWEGFQLQIEDLAVSFSVRENNVQFDNPPFTVSLPFAPFNAIIDEICTELGKAGMAMRATITALRTLISVITRLVVGGSLKIDFFGFKKSFERVRATTSSSVPESPESTREERSPGITGGLKPTVAKFSLRVPSNRSFLPHVWLDRFLPAIPLSILDLPLSFTPADIAQVLSGFRWREYRA